MRAKKKWEKYEEIWSKIRHLIRSISENSNDHDDKYMKIKFDSNDEIPLNKTIEIPRMIIVVGAVFHVNGKYHPSDFFRWMSI